jgi:hypothetical protein
MPYPIISPEEIEAVREEIRQEVLLELRAKRNAYQKEYTKARRARSAKAKLEDHLAIPPDYVIALAECLHDLSAQVLEVDTTKDDAAEQLMGFAIEAASIGCALQSFKQKRDFYLNPYKRF